MKGRDKNSVKDWKNIRTIERAIKRQGGKRINGGRHPHFKHPDGGSVPFSDHRGDLDKGALSGLLRLLLAAGFTCFVPVCLIIWLIAGLNSMY